MNREIKFRAWDISERRMYNDIDFQSNKEYFSSVIMQFTGLHDKNGVGIYEGDIINHYGITGVLTYINDYKILGFYLKSEEKIYDVISNYYSPVLEVLGNIYENPELLK